MQQNKWLRAQNKKSNTFVRIMRDLQILNKIIVQSGVGITTRQLAKSDFFNLLASVFFLLSDSFSPTN
jgi:hypothetical protein